MNELIAALLRKEPDRNTLCHKLDISNSYLSKLISGERVAGKNLINRIAILYPDLKNLCRAVQLSKFVDIT